MPPRPLPPPKKGRSAADSVAQHDFFPENHIVFQLFAFGVLGLGVLVVIAHLFLLLHVSNPLITVMMAAIYAILLIYVADLWKFRYPKVHSFAFTPEGVEISFQNKAEKKPAGTSDGAANETQGEETRLIPRELMSAIFFESYSYRHLFAEKSANHYLRAKIYLKGHRPIHISGIEKRMSAEISEKILDAVVGYCDEHYGIPHAEKDFQKWSYIPAAILAVALVIFLIP